MQNQQHKEVENDLIIAHMATIQGIINRLAGNSANCKTMCVTLIAAVLALLAANKEPQTMKVAYSVLVLMAWLDSFYLQLERKVVALSQASAEKIQNGTFTKADLFKIGIRNRGFQAILDTSKVFFSHSILPFYFVLLCCLLVIQWYFSHIPI